MTRRRLGLSSRLLALATVAAVGLAAPAVAADGISMTVSKGFAVTMTAAETTDGEYDVNPGDDPSAFCRNGTPLTVGWTGATAPISGTNVYLDESSSYAQLDPRRPKLAGKLRAIAVCAKGKGLKPKLKIATSGSSVSCGKKLALGLAATESWPYIEEPVAIGPSGPGGWNAAAGPRPRPTAVCVARSAFKRVKTVRVEGVFRAGAATAKLSAACAGGRRVLAWGYEAAPIAGNTWRSTESSTARSVPFVGDAVPSAGAKRFDVTFRTPDNAPATGEAPLALVVRCGVPAG